MRINFAHHLSSQNVHLLADPSVVRLGGVTVALTASEVVAHLSKEEVHRSEDSENADRMGRMVSARDIYGDFFL